MFKAISFFSHVIENRYMIYQLTKRNVTVQYKRKKLGMFWSLAEPLAIMLILYLVFGIGLRGGRNMEIPFICYLVSGLAATQFFTQTMAKGSVSVRSHSFLLNKVNIKLSVLPVITVLTGIIDHFLFLVAAVVIILLNGVIPNLYWFQLLYYIFALSVFLLGICWFTSAVGVFMPDLQNIISILGRAIFYFSPVIWNFDSIPESLQYWVRFNPIFYVVMGYRESLFYSTPFWTDTFSMVYFWSWSVGMLIIGSFVFRKLRPQFADFI